MQRTRTRDNGGGRGQETKVRPAHKQSHPSPPPPNPFSLWACGQLSVGVQRGEEQTTTLHISSHFLLVRPSRYNYTTQRWFSVATTRRKCGESMSRRAGKTSGNTASGNHNQGVRDTTSEGKKTATVEVLHIQQPPSSVLSAVTGFRAVHLFSTLKMFSFSPQMILQFGTIQMKPGLASERFFPFY